MNTTAYKAGANVRRAVASTGSGIATAARSTAGFARGFWAGIAGKTVVTPGVTTVRTPRKS